jgi:hypothetical protein
MAPFGSASGSPPHGATSTESHINGEQRVPDAERIVRTLGNTRPDITYSKTTRADCRG